MSLTTYTELQTAIANRADRDDLTSDIPDFIRLCEAELNNQLRVSQMEQRATSSSSEEYLTLPADFLAMRSIRINGDTRYTLQAMSPDQMDMKHQTGTSRPSRYAIVGDTIQVNPAPDATYTYEITYWEQIPALANNSTNWLLTDYPGIYLFGSLVQLADHTHSTQSGEWRAQYEALKLDLVRQDMRRRFPGPRRARVA